MGGGRKKDEEESPTSSGSEWEFSKSNCEDCRDTGKGGRSQNKLLAGIFFPVSPHLRNPRLFE